jgi:hypothetical protein
MTPDQPTGTIRCACGWISPVPPEHVYGTDPTKPEFFMVYPTAMSDALAALFAHITGEDTP